MPTVHVLLVLISLILLIVAAVGVPSGRFSLLAAGLAFFVASFLFA